MTGSTVLVSTWSDGVFVIEGGKVRHELAGRGVRGLAADDDGSVLAIVDTSKLCRRDRDGAWAELTESQSPLSCCLISRGEVFVGTDDGAHLCVWIATARSEGWRASMQCPAATNGSRGRCWSMAR
jgi:hypothetical protein